MRTIPTSLRLLAVLLLAATFALAGVASLRAQDATPEPTEEVEETVTAEVTATEEATEETTDAAPTATTGADVTPTDETTAVQGRPVHVHTGTCDELGEVIAPLTDLLAADDTGDADATDDADDADATEEADGDTDDTNDADDAAEGPIPAEVSFTTIDLSLDEMTASDHAINAHLSYDEIDNYVACGEIGGASFADGSIAIGLREQGNSELAGIAYLAPNADDPSQTDVSVFLAEDLADEGELSDPTTNDDSDEADDGTDDGDLEEVTPDATEESESGA